MARAYGTAREHWNSDEHYGYHQQGRRQQAQEADRSRGIERPRQDQHPRQQGRRARTGTPGTFGLKEGGQTPLFKRLPKRGFSNFRFRKVYRIINVGDLEEAFENGATVNAAALVAARMIRDNSEPLKVLGNGTLTKKLVVEANKVSRQAAEKIKAAGGEVKAV